MIIKDDRVREQIKFHEGSNIINGRHMPYKCDSGYWTSGYGRNYDLNGYSEEEVLYHLDNDIARAKEDVAYWMDRLGIPLWTVNLPRQAVLIDMAFCHGRRKLGLYHKMWSAIHMQDWDKAADEIFDSRFGRKDPRRAGNLRQQMREGKYYVDQHRLRG